MSHDRRYEIQGLLDQAGGLTEGAATEVARATGVPEAEVYGVGSFYHLLSRPDAKIRVCTGLSCRMAGADDILKAAELNGLPVEGCTCLAGCDVAPAVLRDRRVLPSVSVEDIHEAKGDWRALRRSARELRDSPAERSAMGRRGRALAESGFHWGAAAERLARLYNSVLKR